MTQEERKLREQLLGVRLIAQEMADEVATARFAFSNSSRVAAAA